jgi:signal transduction histidine kinase
VLERGAGLIKQILSFARGVEGKRVSLQINHLLLEIEKNYSTDPSKINQHSYRYFTQPLDDFGDATQMHQVFMNLCVNARDAMPDGGTLQISAENLLIDEQYAKCIWMRMWEPMLWLLSQILELAFHPIFSIAFLTHSLQRRKLVKGRDWDSRLYWGL